MGQINTQQLKNLGRKDLLDLLLLQAEEIDRLNKENNEWKQRAETRELMVQEAGSMAEAALAVNNVLRDADAAAKDYIYNLELRNQNAEEMAKQITEKAQAQCTLLMENTKKSATEILTKAKSIIERSNAESKARAEQILAQAQKQYDQILAKAQKEADAIRQEAQEEAEAIRGVQTSGKAMSWDEIDSSMEDLYQSLEDVDAMLRPFGGV